MFSAYGNSTERFGLGASLTWRGAEGSYVDLQGQVAYFSTDLNAAGYSVVQDNGGTGFAAGIEAGRAFPLDERWSLTPQAQLNYASVGFDNFTDRFGFEVSLTHGASLKGRLGLTLDYQTGWAGCPRPQGGHYALLRHQPRLRVPRRRQCGGIGHRSEICRPEIRR